MKAARRALALALALALLAGAALSCGERGGSPGEGDSSSASAISRAPGAPVRTVRPLSAVSLAFPGGSGSVAYTYDVETRTATRLATYRESSSVPGEAVPSSRTIETMTFTEKGLPLLSREVALADSADPAAFYSGGEPLLAPPGTALADTPGAVGCVTAVRRYFYEDGALTAALADEAGVRRAISYRSDEAGNLTEAVSFPDERDPALEFALPFTLPPESSAESTARAQIGAEGLPMSLTREREGLTERLTYTYELDGRHIARRTVVYFADDTPLWRASFSYNYDESGRLSRAAWTITYDVSGEGGVPSPTDNTTAPAAPNPDAASSGEGGATADPASLASRGAVLPVEGGYAASFTYADGGAAPLYMAAACPELRQGGLEMGVSPDLQPSLLCPQVLPLS